MPPKGIRAPLRVQNPDNNSDSSDDQSESGAPFYGQRGTNGLRVHVPLSPSSTGNNTLRGLVIQTPVSTSPSPVSYSLPSGSTLLDNRPTHFDRLHERRPSDSPRPFPSPTSDHPRVIKVLASSDGGDKWTTVDLGDARSAQMVKERLFAKLNISPDYQPFYSVHQQQGDSFAGPPLSDDRIVNICQIGDAIPAHVHSIINESPSTIEDPDIVFKPFATWKLEPIQYSPPGSHVTPPTCPQHNAANPAPAHPSDPVLLPEPESA
ncbi:hypothetical protein M408DRAFT_25704 [Serendipita vermifera MAFF 305830]|uniref:Uncharacterized protein n=1 Tax=Serendipita vermifera MAFF 305830 TaxID=933852 RepID=A0A0C2XA24_SERVB|nr:hypothetical protein M408DRAFT_30450 [Serendipita vermifera MAFF 305830]KIM26057.1 hypothetical protein M408DRAFT_25704 [Serendipita vermifera MAFF 305830]